MRENRLIIICVTIIVCVALVCGTIFLTYNSNQENKTNNTTNNNTTVNSTVNDTNNTNNTTTTETSSSKSSGKKSSSSSSNKYIEGNKIESSWDVDEDTQRINTKGDIYYKNKKTGQTSKRHLDSDGVYRYYPI